MIFAFDKINRNRFFFSGISIIIFHLGMYYSFDIF